MTDLGELGPVDVKTGESPKPEIIVACEGILYSQHSTLEFLVNVVGFPVLLEEDCGEGCSVARLLRTLRSIADQADLISMAAYTLESELAALAAR